MTHEARMTNILKIGTGSQIQDVIKMLIYKTLSNKVLFFPLKYFFTFFEALLYFFSKYWSIPDKRCEGHSCIPVFELRVLIFQLGKSKIQNVIKSKVQY